MANTSAETSVLGLCVTLFVMRFMASRPDRLMMIPRSTVSLGKFGCLRALDDGRDTGRDMHARQQAPNGRERVRR